MLKRSRQRGVSVIEGLITVALAALLMSIAVPSVTGWIERYRVRATAESIHAGIQLARAEAMVRNARVRFLLGTDGSWTVACTALTPGCPDTAAIHNFAGATTRGSGSLKVNGSAADSPRSLTFTAQGRPDTSEATRIVSVNVAVATALDSAGASRELRIDVADFGRTRLCYPHAASESLTRC